MDVLELQHIGQIQKARIEFGDLTVLVGPQATGKSITLQLLKLLVDMRHVQEDLRRHGLDWGGKLPEFLDLMLGEGMHSIWSEKSTIRWQNRDVDMVARAKRRIKAPELGQGEQMFFIPAQRVLTLRDGWPRPFTDYSAGDPFAVREFSEKLRLLMEQEFVQGDQLFPRANRLKQIYRDELRAHVFAGFDLKVDRSRPQKRMVLGNAHGELPFMVWSAGQREFMPLLLGLYWLMPPGRMAKRKSVDWVVVEELEMGLHPRAISLMLLLVLELLSRGYRVCLSTHSPQVLEMVWALNHLREQNSSESKLGRLFDVQAGTQLKAVFHDTMKRVFKVYYFERDGAVRNISGLDPGSTESFVAGWGGLTDFSARANEVVASAVADGLRRRKA
ncbi:MAG: AAA family ATPase [Candidatus Delongbacteria bacterium]